MKNIFANSSLSVADATLLLKEIGQWTWVSIEVFYFIDHAMNAFAEHCKEFIRMKENQHVSLFSLSYILLPIQPLDTKNSLFNWV